MTKEDIEKFFSALSEIKSDPETIYAPLQLAAWTCAYDKPI